MVETNHNLFGNGTRAGLTPYIDRALARVQTGQALECQGRHTSTHMAPLFRELPDALTYADDAWPCDVPCESVEV